MPTTPFTDEPGRYDRKLVRGDTLSIVFALSGENADGDEEAYDLTDVTTGECKLRTEPGGTLVASPTVTITDAADGEVEARLEADDTATLKPGKYRYEVRLTWSDDTVSTVLEGAIQVVPSLVS